MTKKDTASQMRKLVKQFKASGQSQKEFASASKLSTPQHSVTPKKDFVAIAVTPEHESGHIMIRLKSGVEIEIPL